MGDILLKEISVDEVKEYYKKMQSSFVDDFILHLRHKDMSSFIQIENKTLEKLCTKDFLEAKYYLEIIKGESDNENK